MNLETIRNLILLTGWPVLIIGSIFLTYKAFQFYNSVNRVVFGKLVMIMTGGWLLTMYSLGIVATVAMYANIQSGVYVVLPIFIVWATTMVILTVIDLSWQKEAVTINEFYQDIERKYQSIFEFSPEAILLLDTTGIILASNDRLQEWLDFKTKDIVGKNIVVLPFLTEESKANIMKNFAERLMGKDSASYQVEFFNKQGGRMFGQVVAATVRDKAGNIIRNLTMISDVTERVKLEKLRDDLTHMIAHDLKNPIVSISSSTSLLIEDIGQQISGQQKSLLNNILITCKKLSNLIMDLLQIKNVEDNKLTLKKEKFNPQELVAGLTWIKDLASQKELNLEINASADLWLEADKDLIGRTIENLLSNAIKHTPPKGQITLNIKEESGQLLFEVIDNGQGIPKQYIPMVFDKFFKVEDQNQGSWLDTGLGLTFCKLAVEAHGGKIGVESEPTKGARFFFTIPQQAGVNF
ncbi:hypothetical protein A2291_02940 [candidate division WOR-1 bacterium RIFOXYB2_FULL_42_35]|uniref:histidine kinase n=1 Tax=candidate division WOR-1 bacterium RIFOXYC2_FULL_41_25 TaxID=1802586 RepID=A0A1F4TR39_UNCSA|nr:MAG: hypothetical protein A2247_01250 [candidate division WOR-1 bacterium RIFOXYA2_FULL_41_14]OGC25705.1 MAG: hypothetical protein A2291_02940 [candidate division WOR-1 bacterium RIFOXYB2_FULL_42_35]OGC35107.1 MAG: hypothetical protein A2462_06085 [candidate division WOR-1 bacterium RIFOXYC2_FULL_41_25]OGC43957.1 MAG: hypothetical protein A2548_05410 [candidate division WOR-1 bacterium RIFOXYD2_FULL_41_8]